jgi:H+-translocating NAD(P) transhydrogenase subunit alpha
VIVDLAAPQGGNVEPSRPGEEVVENGVLIIGPRNLPATLAHDASLTYAKNVANFIGLLVNDGTLTIDTEDDIVRESMVTRDGQIVHDRVRSALDTEGVAR